MSWVGGDIAGLQQMGSQLQAVPGLLNGIVSELAHDVDKLGDDASWSGDAAQAFRKSWTSDSVRVGAIGSVAKTAGDTISQLGNALDSLERALYDEAHACQADGAQIGADGAPLGLVIHGDPNAAVAVRARAAQDEYNAFWSKTKQAAEEERLVAGKTLAGLVDDIVPDDPSKALSPQQATDLAGYLRGLFVAPGEANAEIRKSMPGKITDLKKQLSDAEKALDSEITRYVKEGTNVDAVHSARATTKELGSRLEDLKGKLADAKAGKWEAPGTKALNMTLGELADVDAKGMKVKLPAALDFMKGMPVLDVAASTISAEFAVKDDVEKGWSPTVARANDYTAAAAGMGGAALTAAGATMVVGAAPIEAGVGAAVTSAVAIGAAGVFTGNLASSALHEHWGDDIHNHGVVAGLMHGTSNSFSKAGSDTLDLGKSLWHSVF